MSECVHFNQNKNQNDSIDFNVYFYRKVSIINQRKNWTTSSIDTWLTGLPQSKKESNFVDRSLCPIRSWSTHQIYSLIDFESTDHTSTCSLWLRSCNELHLFVTRRHQIFLTKKNSIEQFWSSMKLDFISIRLSLLQRSDRILYYFPMKIYSKKTSARLTDRINRNYTNSKPVINNVRNSTSVAKLFNILI